jgi:hypothetical protein
MSPTDKTWLTADAARELARKEDPDFYIEKILKMVEVTAKLGQTKMKYRHCGFGDGSLYSGQPNSLQSEIMKRLTALGYRARIGVQELQFVDVYLEIDWS